jgi:hypothetical protein
VPRPARITLWVSFLLAVAGFGSWLIGWPPVVMLVSVGGAAIGLFVLIPYFMLRVPKPVVSVALRIPPADDDPLEIVRRALATIGWVETTDPRLKVPLTADGGHADSIVGFALMAVFAAIVHAASANAMSVVAPPAPAGSQASLLCHPPKVTHGDVRTIVRVSISADAAGPRVTLGGTSLVRDEAHLRTEMAQLGDAIAHAGQQH